MDSPKTLSPGFFEDQRPELRGLTVFFLVLATAAVLVRTGFQVKVHRRLFWDDAWIMLAVIFMDALCGVNLFGMSKGLGLHASRVAMSDPHMPSVFITLWKVGFTNSILTQLCLFTTKMSLLLLYMRLFWVAKWFRIAWWFNLVFAVGWILAAVFAAVFQCTPVSFAWNRMYLWMHIPPPFPVHGTCISQYFVTVIASLSLASDVGIWAMPMAAVFKLQMEPRRKIGTCLLLSLGLCAVACGIGKAVGSYQALSSVDVSWSNAPLTIWAEAELAAGILCACIPVIAGTVRAFLKQRRQAASSSTGYHVGSGYSGTGASEKRRATAKAQHLHSSESDVSRVDYSVGSPYSPCHWADEVEMHTPRKHREWV